MLPVKHTDENPPATIPTIRGNANSLIDVTPMMNKKNTIMNVVRDVLIDLERVCVTELLTISLSLAASFVDEPARFSRILSKITIVALME